MRHANRGRLLLRTPGPVLFGTCICSTCWDQRRTISMRHYTSLWQYYRTCHFTESEISPDIGFHRESATGVACRQGTLTPPDTWSCPTLGLASVLMLRPISPELVLFLDLWVSNIPRYFCFCFKSYNISHSCQMILRQGDILKPLPFSFYFISQLSLLCILVRLTIQML